MSLIIQESKWEFVKDEQGGVIDIIEMNMHDSFKQQISDKNPDYELNINNILKEIEFLKTKGFDIILSMKTGNFNLNR